MKRFLKKLSGGVGMKMLKIVLVFIVIVGIAGCSTTKKAVTPLCNTMYEIYAQCYKLGIGQNDSSFCGKLTLQILKEFSIEDKQTAAYVSLFCGMACSQARNKQGMMSYSEFVEKCSRQGL